MRGSFPPTCAGSYSRSDHEIGKLAGPAKKTSQPPGGRGHGTGTVYRRRVREVARGRWTCIPRKASARRLRFRSQEGAPLGGRTRRAGQLRRDSRPTLTSVARTFLVRRERSPGLRPSGDRSKKRIRRQRYCEPVSHRGAREPLGVRSTIPGRDPFDRPHAVPQRART